MSDLPSIFLYAPTVGLAHGLSEVFAIVNSGLHVEIAPPGLSAAELDAAVSETPARIFWAITHMTAAGLVAARHISTHPINDGAPPGPQPLAILPMSQLIPIARKFDLVILNTCDSKDIADELQRVTDVAVIGTKLVIDDEQAALFGGRFARALVALGEPVLAFAAARPGHDADSYFYLASTRKAVPDFLAGRRLILESPIL